MSYAMGLTTEQRLLVGRLPVGTGIVKLAGRFPTPFLIQIPDFPIEKNVGDRELAEYMESHLAALSYQERYQPTPSEIHAPAPEEGNSPKYDPEEIERYVEEHVIKGVMSYSK